MSSFASSVNVIQVACTVLNRKYLFKYARIYSLVVLTLPAKKSDRDLLDVLELSDGGPAGHGNVKVMPKPFDNILASMTSSSKVQTGQAARKTNHTAEPLSAEAAAVLAHLPDLSFMHAKVLMFPVGDFAN
jgi:hypothetical protein